MKLFSEVDAVTHHDHGRNGRTMSRQHGTPPPPDSPHASETAHNPPGVLAIFDLDGTLTRRDTYLAYLAGFTRKHPHRITRLHTLPLDVARFYSSPMRDNAWLKQRFLHAVLAGVDRATVRAWTREFNERLFETGLRRAALEQVADHRRLGHRLMLATASLDIYVHDLADRLGFTDVVCTHVEWDPNDRLTGRLAGTNCHGQEKAARVIAHLRNTGKGWRTFVYTNHHSDVPLLNWADERVAVSPTAGLARQADTLKLRVVRW